MTTKPKTDTSVGAFVGKFVAVILGAAFFLLIIAGSGVAAGIFVNGFRWVTGI